jgi:hypothetical protein
MKRPLLLTFLCSVAAFAQFGGLGKLKDKVDQMQQKAKPATDRAQKAPKPSLHGRRRKNSPSATPAQPK